MIVKKRFRLALVLIILTSIVLIINSCDKTDEYIVKEVISNEIEPCGFDCTYNDMDLLRTIAYESVNYSARTAVSQVPISLNVIRNDNGSNDLTADQIQEQLDITNQMYLGAGIEFVICGDVNYVNSTSLSSADGVDRYNLKNAYNIDNVINMYVTSSILINQTNVCGFAYYPGGEEVVFLTNNCFRNGSTLPHELGHFFSLIHTHGTSNTPNGTDELSNGSNGATTGDMIQDTPSDPKLSGYVDYYCNYTGDFLDNNGQPHNPDPNNIMSYSRKECRNFFSAGQLDLINYTLVTYRSNLTCNYLEPDGSEENPFIIDSEITSNLNLNNGDCETNNEIIYYATSGDLQLNDFRIRLKGQVKLTVNGNVNGSDIAKIVSRDCAEVCVSGLVNVMSRQFRDGTINADCGIPIGSINNPKVVNQIFTKTRNIKNGNCNTDSLKHFIRYGDIELGDFDLRVIGKSVLTITGDVNGNGTLIAKKCGSITVNGIINVETLEQSGGVIN